jgi:hypothetical protein
VVSTAVAMVIAAFALGRGRPPELAPWLLRLEAAAGSEDRLAALHELRRRGAGGPYRRRIEAALGRFDLAPRRLLPLPLRVWLLSAAGILLIGGAVVVGFALGPAAQGSGALPDPVPRAAGAGTAASEEPPPTGAVSPGEPQVGSSRTESLPSDVEPDAAPGGQALSETIPTTGETVLGGAPESIEELLQEQSSLLSQLEERVDALGSIEEGGLPEDDAEALEELAAQLPDSALRDAVEELLEQTDPGAAQDALERLSDLLADPSSGGAEEAPGEHGQDADPTGGNELWTPPPPEPDGEPLERQDGGEGEGEVQVGGTEPGEGGADRGEDAPVAPFERMLGGTEGEAQEEDSSYRERGEPAFYEAEIEGEIGLDGAFEEFVTQGVPLEPAPRSEDGSRVLRVDYEALRAILDQRAIAPEDEDTIRRYFERITEGGS